MNRASNELRKVFVNLYNEGLKSDKIAKTIGVTGRCTALDTLAIRS